METPYVTFLQIQVLHFYARCFTTFLSVGGGEEWDHQTTHEELINQLIV